MHGQPRTAVAVLLALLVATPFIVIGLGRAPFDDPGEGMHAEIARELAVSGDPLALTLNGVRYVDKPPLLYVLMGGSFALLGPNEGSARLVAALGALVTLAATAALGARLLGRGGGVLAAVALLTSIGFFAYARYVRPETLFLAALTGGLALVLVGLLDERRGLVVAGLGVFGLAGLAKDSLGVIGPPVVIGLALWLAGAARPVSRWLPPTGAALLLVLGFGWWLVVEARSPGFTWYTVVDNHVLNVMRARRFPDEDVPLTALQFLLVAALAAAPWIVAALSEGVSLVRRRAWRDSSELPWLALALWGIAVLGLTALSPFRLPHYGLPAYPALALLAARRWMRPPHRALLVGHAIAFGVIAAGCAVMWRSDGAAFAGTVMGAADVATRKAALAGQTTALPAWEDIRALFGATALVFAAGAGAVAVAAAGRRRLWGVLAVSATMLALLPVVATGLSLVAGSRAVRDLAVDLKGRVGPGDLVVHEGPIENSGALEWYLERRPVILDGRRSVLGFGATRPEAAAVMWDAAEFATAWGGTRRVWVVTGRGPDRSLAARMPGARLVAVSHGRWLYVNN